MTLSAARRAQYAKIEIGKKQLGLDDTTYRDMIAGVTGKNSRKDCTEDQLSQVIAHMIKSGAVFTSPKTPRTGRPSRPRKNFYEIPDGIHAKQKRFIAAMWKELGYSMTALDTRVKRQTGIETFLWCNDPDFLQTLAKDLTVRLKNKKKKAAAGG